MSDKELHKTICKAVGWSYVKDGWAFEKTGEKLNVTHRLDKLVTLYENHAEKRAVDELEDLSLEVIEPCEPDCDEVRHALHEGSWKAHIKIEHRLAQLKESQE